MESQTDPQTAMSSIRQSGSQTLFSIQYLRAIAATAVVLAHASTSLLARDRSLIHLEAGGCGVDLFFVISGFIMFYTTDGRWMTRADFYRKRLIRIVPLYFLLTTIAFVLAVLMPHAFHTLTARPFDYLRSVCFVPFYNGKVQGLRPEIGQGWTLNDEMFFYLIFGFCLPLGRLLRLGLSAIILCSLALLGSIFHPVAPLLRTYTDPLLLEFLLGMVLGYSASSGQSGSRLPRAFQVLVAAGCAWMALGALVPSLPLPRFVLIGIPSAALVGGALWMERRGWLLRLPWMITMGDISYSLYLSHGFVLALLRRFWLRSFDVHAASAHLLYIATTFAVSVPLAVLIHRMIERPASDWLTFWWKRRSSRKRSALKGVEMAIEHLPCGCRPGHRDQWASSPMKTPLQSPYANPRHKENALKVSDLPPACEGAPVFQRK
jgi:exopolysaccharide production protein ExoZ